MAPETPKSATAQGPMQHKPMKEANALMPMAPPVVAAVVLSVLVTDDFFMEITRFPMMYKSTCCHIYPEPEPVKYKLCQYDLASD